MASENVIQATFDGFYKIHTKPSWLIDHGMELSISGIDLPDEFECHFSNSRSVAAKRQIGENGVVTIPDEYFLSNAAQIFCWIYLHPTVDSGVTEYEIVIPLLTRPNVDPSEPTQEQQDIVDQAIAALNVAMAETSADAESASASATAAQAAVDSVLNMTVSADTLPSGSDASVTKSVVDDAVHLAFGIPQGAQGVQGEQGVQGPTGATPNFTIGTVQTLLPTQDATATITGTAKAPVLNLGIPKGYSGDATNLAADYSSNKIYAVGEYCIYNGSLYRCITAITTAEAWTAAHWTAAVLGDDIGDLKSDISTDDVITWNQLSSVFTRASGNLAGVTYTRSPDRTQAVFNGTPTKTDFFQLIQSGLGTSVVGHKYAIFTPRISGSVSGYWFFYLNSRNVRDTGAGAIWTADSSANLVVGIEWNNNQYIPTFNNLTVNLPIITDLTVCFGVGNEPTIEEFRAMFPNDSYPKDTGTQRKLTRYEKNSLDIYHNSNAIAKTQSSIRLKALTFNCGHYNYGSGSEGSWTGDELAGKIKMWKDMLAKYKPDIMFGQEMSQYFDSARTVNAIDTIFRPLLPNYYFHTWTRLLSKYAYRMTWHEDITVTVSGTTYERTFGTAIINISGVDILICSVHLPTGYTATDTSVREAMRDKLIAAFASYPYVILGGDFNESTDSFYTPFVTAGYSLGNHGYFGTITTLPNESVDNIIVKGFTFYDAVSDSADACTSDHYPFASELHIV